MPAMRLYLLLKLPWSSNILSSLTWKITPEIVIVARKVRTVSSWWKTTKRRKGGFQHILILGKNSCCPSTNLVAKSDTAFEWSQHKNSRKNRIWWSMVPDILNQRIFQGTVQWMQGESWDTPRIYRKIMSAINSIGSQKLLSVTQLKFLPCLAASHPDGTKHTLNCCYTWFNCCP